MKVYTTDRSAARTSTARVKVGVADYAAAEAGSTLVTSGLGSCVGIALADVDAGVAGLAHAMLPAAGTDRTSTGERGGVGDENETSLDEDSRPTGAKYVDTAIPALVEEMLELGAARSRIEARLAGGSAMFNFTSRAGAVGERNIAAARETLEHHDIPLVASDVGGDHGRSLSFDASTGELTIRRAHDETQVI